MSLWEFSACVDGYVRANTASGELAESRPAFDESDTGWLREFGVIGQDDEVQ